VNIQSTFSQHSGNIQGTFGEHSVLLGIGMTGEDDARRGGSSDRTQAGQREIRRKVRILDLQTADERKAEI
jgi:hypothetical protein